MDSLNKKAVVFTFITVLLLTVLIINFLVNLNYRDTQSKIQSVNVKVDTINSFVKSLNSSYIPSALRVSSNDVMIDLLNYEDQSHQYVSNVDNYFIQNLPGKIQPALNDIISLAAQQGIVIESIEPQYNTINLYQTDPWQVIIKLKFNYKLRDNNNEAIWDIKDRGMLAILNVDNYRDPLHLVEEDPGFDLKITKILYLSSYFSDLYNFKKFIENANFTNNPSAPSFLNRLQGEKNLRSAYGIESILDPFYYTNEQSSSNVDYQYYSPVLVLGLCVKDMPINFKLDQDHINYYGREIC